MGLGFGGVLDQLHPFIPVADEMATWSSEIIDDFKQVFSGFQLSLVLFADPVFTGWDPFYDRIDLPD